MQTEATKAFAAKAFPTFCGTKQLRVQLLLQQLVSHHPAGDASLLQDYPASQQ